MKRQLQWRQEKSCGLSDRGLEAEGGSPTGGNGGFFMYQAVTETAGPAEGGMRDGGARERKKKPH
jgi:hypothetical protein